MLRQNESKGTRKPSSVESRQADKKRGPILPIINENERRLEPASEHSKEKKYPTPNSTSLRKKMEFLSRHIEYKGTEVIQNNRYLTGSRLRMCLDRYHQNTFVIMGYYKEWTRWKMEN